MLSGGSTSHRGGPAAGSRTEGEFQTYCRRWSRGWCLWTEGYSQLSLH